MAQITARSLYLVFEHLDLDLKKYMDSNKDFCKNHGLVKVRASCVTPGAMHHWTVLCMRMPGNPAQLFLKLTACSMSPSHPACTAQAAGAFPRAFQ